MDNDIGEDEDRDAPLECETTSHYKLEPQCTEDQSLLQIREFVDNHILFSGWPVKFRRLLETSIEIVTLSYGNTLVKQGDKVDGLYFIIKGQARVVFDWKEHKANYKNLFDRHKAYVDKQGVQYEQKERKTRPCNKTERVRIRRDKGYAAAEQRLREKDRTICFVNKNECIGDIELVTGMKTNHQSVVCTTKTTAYFISNETVEKLILRRYPQTVTTIRKLVTEKLFHRVHLTNSSQIELYNVLLWQLRKISRSAVDAQNVPKSTSERQNDLMIERMVKLFLADKMPFIKPRVSSAVYHKMRSLYREKRSPSPPPDPGRLSGTPKPPSALPSSDFRQSQAILHRKTARSRRELQRMQSTQEENYHVDFSVLIPNSTVDLIDLPLPPNKETTRRQSVARQGSAVVRQRSAVGRTTRKTTTHRIRPQTAVGVEGKAVTRGDPKTRPGSANGIFRLTQGYVDEDSDGVESIQGSENRDNNTVNLLRRDITDYEDNSFDSDSSSSDDYFDWETSDRALGLLEDKIRNFHNTQDHYSQKRPYKLRELRRFSIQGPGSIPVAGGTVMMKPRPCEHSTSHSPHRHVRTFIVPKNAQSIARKTVK